MEQIAGLCYRVSMSPAKDDDRPSIEKLVPQQKRSREARDRIIASAEAVLRDAGVDGFSMAAVAEAADMPVGNIYRRFIGKEDLLQSMKDLVSRRIRDGIAERLQSSRHDSLREFIMSFAGTVAEIFARDEHLNRTLYDARLINPDLARSGQRARASIFEIFERGVAPYLKGADQGDAPLATKVAFSIIMNAVAFKVRDNDSISRDIAWDQLANEFGEASVFYLSGRARART